MWKRQLLPQLSLGICLFSFVSMAKADLRWIETSELVPTASVVELPRTYLVPSTYVSTRTVVTPSSVVLPTTSVTNVYGVTPTTYYVPSSYVSTRYYRAYRPRRYLETAYVSSYPTTLTPTYYLSPSVYLAPTSFVSGTGLVTTSADLCCETAAAPVIRVSPTPTETAPIKTPQKSADLNERRPGATLDSTVAEPDYRTEANKPVRDDGLNTTNGSVESKTATSTLRNTPSASGSPTGRDATSGPPESAKPVVVKEKPLVKDAPVQPSSPVKTPAATSPASDASKKAASTLPRTAIPPPVASPPIAPEPDPISPLNSGVSPLDEMPALPDPKTEEATRRDSLKPVFPSTDSPRSKRNVLEGKIVSADSLNPEENVEVVISDQTGRFLDRTTRTNAFGQFAISLPEGDWTIRVTMPSGRILSVEQGRISASAGKIIDMYGRDLKNLVIKR